MMFRCIAMTLLCALITIGCSAVVLADTSAGVVPKAGFVPDAATAIKIAEAVLIPIYGQTKIESERPFRAILQSEVWVVSGTLPAGDVGGVAIVKIAKRDARVLSVIHGK